MARATEAEVKEIIVTELTLEEVTPFLTAANVLVTELLTGESYGDDLLREIERWLAAHFVAIRDPRITKEKTGDADATYQGKTGMGLKGTTYGQQAMAIDHHGKLAEVANAKGAAEFKVVHPI